MELVRTSHVEITTMALFKVSFCIRLRIVQLMSRTLITLCPSPSTTRMLESQQFDNVRLWPRGVDLEQFGPRKRSAKLRASWGVGDVPRNPCYSKVQPVDTGLHWQGRKASLPMTPPMTPEVIAFNGPPSRESSSYGYRLDERVVLLYVGRM
jgi:hypothetical protein